MDVDSQTGNARGQPAAAVGSRPVGASPPPSALVRVEDGEDWVHREDLEIPAPEPVSGVPAVSDEVRILP